MYIGSLGQPPKNLRGAASKSKGAFHAGKEIRENIFSEVKHLLHDLDAGMLPISVFFPYLPIPKHNARDKSALDPTDETSPI